MVSPVSNRITLSHHKIDRFPAERENFEWYKVILTHQAGHLEFGMFNFELERPSRLFRDWRQNLAAQMAVKSTGHDLERLRQLFPDPELGNVFFD